MKDIATLSDRDLTNLETNYVRKGVTVGGVFSLAEVRLEKMRRQPTTLGTVDVARKIVDLARQSEDGLTTYGELWQSLNPSQAWKGNATQRLVANALIRVLAYCVTNRLPILTVLVVQTGNRRLTDQAIGHIFNEARELGVETGTDPKAFVDQQRVAAMAVTEFPETVRGKSPLGAL